MKEVILNIKNLDKTYTNDGIENQVIKNMNLEIYKGDFTVIMGPSGSGKSTLLYCLGAMEDITNGNIFFKDKNIIKMKENKLSDLRLKEFGFIFQQIHLISNLSIYENIILPGLALSEKNNNYIKERVNKLLERFGLTKIAKHLPSQTSGGEQQRTAIARSLINSPEILFADEPTGALNQKNSEIVMDLLTELNKENLSILLVTHDKKAALRGNRILYIIDGNIKSEISLEKYGLDNLEEREKKVNEWLSSLDW